ncbi:fibrinogen-like protein A [Mizuhopecten yessoensis]|uniref:fibrinogen-like protein A n=1 Tax=Mizuhopecten yessoensis TaxID=6573 RepID=UPI000B458DF5|nr:fibrinogen-like protein A [Mizuhopecten yessoensis]
MTVSLEPVTWNILTTKMKFLYFIMVLISVDASAINKRNKFTRVQRVAQQDLSLYKLNSNTGMRSSFECAIQCEKEGCLSFSYTNLEKRCVTYSETLDEDQNADVSVSTKYFSKGPNICKGVPQGSPSGEYQIKYKDGSSMNLFCDMDAAEGPWAVIHSRTHGNVDFYRNWVEYKNGFGNLNGDFWIGKLGLYMVQNIEKNINFKYWFPGEFCYPHFTTGDGMDYGNGFGFTTYDKDNDGRDPTSKDCAEERHGAWWHDRCTLTNLNGVYHQEDGYDWEAMSWIEFPDPDRYFTPLRKAKMMIRWIK